MPMIEFPCPHCDVKISADPEHAGKSANCPTCDQELVVPDDPGPPVIVHAPAPAQNREYNKSEPRSVATMFNKSKRLIFGCASVVLMLMTVVGIKVAGTAATTADSTTAGSLPPLSRSVPDGFVLVPAGEFTMGDTLDGIDDAPPHNVNLSAFLYR